VTAPVRTADHELNDLDREFDVVAAVWPDKAERIRAAMGPACESLRGAPDLVLSHGDYTPSQVLLEGQSVAIVDLDTLCWGEPALDLGRYLAHLRLLTVKAGGSTAETFAWDLGDEFLRGYADTSARTAAAVRATNRIRLYQAITLARSALRACRQLKPDRYESALLLLERVRTERVNQ
jgi:aminoglycoside phosphotransferase (APT) family kinase protein